MTWMMSGLKAMIAALLAAETCRALMWLLSVELSWEKTRAPRIEAPATAPISLLVLAADAAMPDRSGGTASSTAAVTGTTVMPMPTPARARASDRAT